MDKQPMGHFHVLSINKLFVLSGGIPRLLNLLCDRALLGGYSQQKAIIDAKLVEQAGGEILAIKQPEQKPKLPVWVFPLLFVLCVVIGVLATLFLTK